MAGRLVAALRYGKLEVLPEPVTTATLPVRRYEGTSAGAVTTAEPFILTEFLFDIIAV
jgi:hypothetical protein